MQFFSMIAAIAIAGALPAAVQAPFPAPATQTLANGALIVSDANGDVPATSIQVFLPAGVGQQPASKAGVAAVAAYIVLHTPVEQSMDLQAVAQSVGASASYVVEPQDTRFSIECRTSDVPRLLGDLGAALAHPDASRFAAGRDAALGDVRAAGGDPVMIAYAMIRQVQYAGTSYAQPDAGRAISLAALTPEDAAAFIGRYRTGKGSAVAMAGLVDDAALAAARSLAGGFASSAAPAPAPNPSPKSNAEVVAHRDIAVPWVAIGFAVPTQFSPDFAAMLVIESLLGRGGDVQAFSYGSDASPPDDYVGGYYQFEAQPGTFIEFFNGAGVDQDLRNLSDGVTRLRSSPLTPDLLAQAKRAALGGFLTSVSTLDDRSWLLGRSALSPQGVSFENALPAQIAAVTASDVQRVARKYLSSQTVAVVLPSGAGQ